MVVIAQRDAHRALFGTVGTYGCTGLESDVGELAVAVVAVKILRRRVVGDVNVRTTLLSKSDHKHAEAVVASRIVNAGLFRDFGERSIAVVVVERIARTPQATGTALHVETTVFAGWAATERPAYR